ncbi:MAG: RNA-binding protein [Eubacterium sp.]|nr:RNA-binding protein [Eubacterium sp.]
MKLGEWNILRIDRIKDVGAYLTDGKGLECTWKRSESAKAPEEIMDVLLPTRQIPEGLEIGDNVEVFLYRDSEDRIIATTHTPLIRLGEIKKLKVKSVSDIGAFLDWGLSRDLFLPFKEQIVKVQQEKSYLVKLYIDKTGRLAASMKIASVLKPNDTFKKGDHVKGIVYNVKKDFGVFVALYNKAIFGETGEDVTEDAVITYTGLIHSSEVFENLYVGDEVTCRVVKAREDGKLDLAMRDEIPLQMEKDAEMVLDIIKSYGGKLPFNDKADAALIKKEFGLSKNAFKRAVGRLYKNKLIEINDDNITIL